MLPFHPRLNECQDLSLITHACLYRGNAMCPVLCPQMVQGHTSTFGQTAADTVRKGHVRRVLRTSCVSAQEPHAALDLHIAFQGPHQPYPVPSPLVAVGPPSPCDLKACTIFAVSP